ncbi:MAG: 2-C-methyl-D-erythritol 4-phosphate cytidylyltransferase [Actinomycetota bacterium]|nr:2-C-methyl-D-erythritol 4-phosphate cytidylyltransferase [Actinomycetota bacterium]
MTRAAFVVLAGGSGTRVGAGVNKVYLPLAGRKVISWSFVQAAQVPEVDHFVLVTRSEDVALARGILDEEVGDLDVEVVVGGATRHGSEQAALDLLRPRIEAGEVEVVAVHDGARPLAGPALIGSVIRAAASAGGALPGLPARDLLPVGDAPAGALVRVQTPQAFRAKDLLLAYEAAAAKGFEGTDTASSVEEFSGLAVQVVPGSRRNLKVTYPHDLLLAERLLAERLPGGGPAAR